MAVEEGEGEMAVDEEVVVEGTMVMVQSMVTMTLGKKEAVEFVISNLACHVEF